MDNNDLNFVLVTNIRTKKDSVKVSKLLRKHFFGHFIFPITGKLGAYTISAQIQFTSPPRIMVDPVTGDWYSTTNMSPSDIWERVRSTVTIKAQQIVSSTNVNGQVTT